MSRQTWKSMRVTVTYSAVHVHSF